MTNLQRRIYAAMVGLHPPDFRKRFGSEMILDFEECSGSHQVANFYLDALQSVVRQWASHLSPSTLEPLPAQASLLSGQYVSLSQQSPSLFELVRASCIATLLFVSIGFAAAPRLRVERMANFGTVSKSAASARYFVRSAARRTGGSVASDAKTVLPARSEGREPTLQATRGLDLSLAVSYIVSLCLYLILRGLLQKPKVLRTVLVTGIMLAIAAPVHAQMKQAVLSFDVVTVKPSDPQKEHLALYWRQGDGLKWDGVTLTAMVANAYGVSPIVKGQIEGGPAWMGSRVFDILGKVDAVTAARWSRMTQAAVDEERRSLMRSLLADRFQLKFHHETRELPVLVLRLAKSGSKLQSPQPEHDLQAGTPQSRINFLGRGQWEGHSALISNLARSLASEPEIAGRPVVDKTGLTGGYDFTLRWTPDVPASGADQVDPNAQWPSLFTAINEQLGLKLTSEKQPIDILVVDSVEMPNEN